MNEEPITEEQLDVIGQIVEHCDNGLSALKLPLRPELHVQGLKGIIETIRRKSHDLYVELGGDSFDFDEAAAVEAAQDRRP